MPDRHPSAAEVQDRLDVYLNRHGPSAPTIYRVLLTMLVAGLLALPLIRVSLTVAAPGVLRPEIERHEVRVASGGHVARLHASVGEAVGVGDTLATFAAEPLLGQARALHSRIEETKRLQRDLRAAIALVSEDARADLGTGEVRAEWARLSAERSQRRIAIERAEREFRRALPLAMRGLLAQAEMEEAQVRLDGERAAEALAVASQLAAWRSRLGAVEAESVQLRAEAAEVAEQLRRSVVLSPVAGTVEEMLSLSAGSFVGPGDLLAVVSPSARLVAEAFLSPAEVGAVRPGIPARVHVDAYDFTDWGALSGTVESISDDYVPLDGGAAFRISVRLDDPELRLRQGQVAHLRKGMTVRTHFVLAERSLLQLIRDRAENWFDPRHSSRSVPS